MDKIYFRKLILSSKKLQHELRVAFGLIGVALIVFLGYLFPGASDVFQTKINLPISVGIALFIVAIGLLIILQIVEPVIKISRAAKQMAAGDLEREIQIARADEIGELGEALNRMSGQIKSNVQELKKFSEEAEAINLEINRRIVTFSSLIEISNLISQNADLESIYKTSLDNCLEFGSMSMGCLILKDRASGELKIHTILSDKSDELIKKGIKNYSIKLGAGLLGKTVLKQSLEIIDSKTKNTEDILEFKRMFEIENAILAPITSKGNVFGLLIVGTNEKNYVCSDTAKEVFFLIAKQIAIGITNELLNREIEKLAVTDHLTGLYNNTYTRKKLNEDIKKAATMQKPCSFVLFSIDRFDDFNNTYGHIAAEDVLIKVGNLFKDCVKKDDKASRFGDHEFALILPGKTKRDSIKEAEAIRQRVQSAFADSKNEKMRLTCSGAITENPIDGVTADELILKSGVLLVDAVNSGGNKIVY